MRRSEIAEMGEVLRRVRVVVVEWAVVAMTAEGTVWTVVLIMLMTAVASMGRRGSHSRFQLETFFYLTLYLSNNFTIII